MPKSERSKVHGSRKTDRKFKVWVHKGRNSVIIFGNHCDGYYTILIVFSAPEEQIRPLTRCTLRYLHGSVTFVQNDDKNGKKYLNQTGNKDNIVCCCK